MTRGGAHERSRTFLDARRFAVYFAWILLIAGAYVFFGKMGLTLAFAAKQVTAVWPPTGIAVAALILGGYRMWPGIFLGAFVANAVSDEPLITAAGIALGNTAGPLVAAYLLRLVHFDRNFSRVRDALVFLGFASILAMTVTATNGTLELALAHIAPWSHLGAVWSQWWIGDASGVLLVAPLILTWSNPRSWSSGEREAGPIEIAILLLALTIALASEFFSRNLIAFPLYPFVVWAALRVGARFTTAVIVISCSVALWASLHNLGPFIAVDAHVRMTGLVAFTAVLAVTGLVLCALTSERRAALAQSQAAERRFQVLAQTVPQIVWTADSSGEIDWFNERWHHYTGEERLVTGIPEWTSLIAAGRPFERELLLRSAQGISRWFLLRAEPMYDDHGALIRWYGTHTDIDDQRRELERSSRIATTLQSAFLPETLPQHPNVKFDALYLTAGQEGMIGGDWYDTFTLADDRIVISIGDVTGHGLQAAVGAGRIRQSIVATAIDQHDPAAILFKVNRLLQFHDTTVATALVAVFDPKALTLQYASAGHPPPIVAAPGVEAFALSHGALPLGVSRTAEYQTFDVALERGSVMLFYTDGITEFERDIETAELNLRRAVDALAARPSDRPSAQIRHAILGDAPPVDDVVLLVLSVGAGAQATVPARESPLHKAWNFHSNHAYSAHSARHELMRFITEHAASDQEFFNSELIVGELLANTVEHAPGLVNVEIDWTDFFPVVTVIDNGPGLVRFAGTLPGDEFTEDGRGLFLVQTLARDVRVETDRGHGTKISVTLPLARSSNRSFVGKHSS
jgi:integral membrane sensor domain MASE1/anti-sigma regulatory factor (Ser/Thr protein kinase)